MTAERDIEVLAQRFQAKAVSRAEWTHEAHLAIGLWHVARFGAVEALARLRDGIRALNEANGVANTATGGYHETITHAYVVLIERFLVRRGLAAAAPGNLQGEVDALLADPLADRAALFAYWTRDTLLSPQARAGWVEPDLAALPNRREPAGRG